MNARDRKMSASRDDQGRGHPHRDLGPLTKIVVDTMRGVGSRAGHLAALPAVRDGVALAGYAFALWVTFVAFRPDGFTVADPAGYLRAGHALLTGTPVYVGVIGDPLAVSYAPPWIVAFALLSALPAMIVQVLMTAVNAAALWYVTGGWRGVGFALFWPITIGSVLSGNIDLPIAAALVMAWRGRAWPLALVGLAKLGPFLGVPLTLWRQVALAVTMAGLVTLPWLGLWPDWIAYLFRQPIAVQGGLAIAWWVRLPIAVGLALLIRRPWAQAVAVFVGMPSLYGATTMVLLAAVRLWLDGRRDQHEERNLHLPKAGGTAMAPTEEAWQ